MFRCLMCVYLCEHISTDQRAHPPPPRPGREPSISSDTRTDSSTESYSYRQPPHSHHKSLASHCSSDSQGTVICTERPDGALHASLGSLDTIGGSEVRGREVVLRGGGAYSRSVL